MEKEAITVRKMIMFFPHSRRCKRTYLFLFNLVGDPLYAPISQSTKSCGTSCQ